MSSWLIIIVDEITQGRENMRINSVRGNVTIDLVTFQNFIYYVALSLKITQFSYINSI